MDNWNDDWKDELHIDNPKLMDRLSECRSTKNDIKIIAKKMYQYNFNHTKEECLDRTIEWITDWNNQASLVPDDEEYKKILECIK